MGLAFGCWSIFVDFSRNNSLVFRALAVIFWSVLFLEEVAQNLLELGFLEPQDGNWGNMELCCSCGCEYIGHHFPPLYHQLFLALLGYGSEARIATCFTLCSCLWIRPHMRAPDVKQVLRLCCCPCKHIIPLTRISYKAGAKRVRPSLSQLLVVFATIPCYRNKGLGFPTKYVLGFFFSRHLYIEGR